MGKLEYICTNEHLETIVEVLCPKQNEKILAIGGSGDVPFALLEFSESLLAVDYNSNQIKYIRSRVNFLKKKEYDKFLKNNYGNNELYFLAKDRLNRIREKLDSLQIIGANILDLISDEINLNKIYLSNIMTYNGGVVTYPFILDLFAQKLPIDGLIYVSDHYGLSYEYKKAKGTYLKEFSKKESSYLKLDCSFLPPNLILEETLTDLAFNNHCGFGTPAVYKKVESEKTLTNNIHFFLTQIKLYEKLRELLPNGNWELADSIVLKIKK